MSNRGFIHVYSGNHGDGDPQNTETPICAWGAGISKSTISNNLNNDSLSKSWEMDHIERKDVNQADIAPLMVYFI
jgi:phosphatidylinositol glycan class N